MNTIDLIIPVGIVLASGLGLPLLVLLPWMIASRRKAQYAARIRQMSLAGVVLATFGFLWILLNGHRSDARVIFVGIAPGGIVWFISLIWGCLGRPAQIIRGFEVQPMSTSGDSSK